MKIGLGLYRHMLTRDYYDFAGSPSGDHLVDYFNSGTQPGNNNPPVI
jgi:mannonate dehydratase